MGTYNLEPNEFVIMQRDNVTLMIGAEQQRLKEIVLTNLNLILVQNVKISLFKSVAMVKRCPLSTLQTSDGIPQAIVTKVKDDWWIQAPFEEDVIKLKFAANERYSAKRWAKSICQAAAGDLEAIDTESDPRLDEITGTIQDATAAIGSIFGKTVERAKDSSAKTGAKPANTTKKCIGCHAPLTGKSGATLTCPYCDTKQSL